MPLKRLKTPHLFGGTRRDRFASAYGGKKRPIFSVSLRHKDAPNLVRKCSHFLVGDKARTRPVLKLEKRQDNLELSYLCRTFVLLMEWQERKTRTQARQGKKKRCRYDTTTRQVHLLWNCKLPQPNRYEISRQGKSVHNLEMHDLQFGIVIPLSYLCSVEIRTKSNQYE
jgi:hypothetical protein